MAVPRAAPNWLARLMNKASATVASWGVANYLETLEVTGRKSGRTFSLPVVIAVVDGQRPAEEPFSGAAAARADPENLSAPSAGSAAARTGEQRRPARAVREDRRGISGLPDRH